ncbi:hypothetical protein C2S53_007557 [Perilla frutescens var. hirtella]|uniref:Uncharacterized protein n=1 Tax=Perilla frutescens var. hirtella TaxID=608512 RepID=A0AAD4JBJ1_PERFH|nr:hypothetical protein C2S53_007557 [Perilla frutescens var. hirtella]
MKFTEELATQTVQEWQAAYMAYNILKKVLNNLMKFRQQRATSSPTGGNSVRGSPRNDYEEIVIVNSDHTYYQTMHQRSIEEGSEFELEFFSKFDDEFNKVSKFYKAKLQQVKVEAEELIKAVDKPNVEQRHIASVNGVGVHLDIIQEVEMRSESDTNSKEELRQAFIKLYKQLRQLRSFCFLNMLAFSKIMNKYDKITSRSASNACLGMLNNSYLATSDEVHKLTERLESTFIMHFANGDHTKGKKSLKQGLKREKHRTTFFLGLFTGCSIALVMAIIVSLHARDLLNHPGRDQYMESIFPLYSLFGFIILHLLMYGSNMYLWRRFRVNYPSIFGFKPETELGFREVLLIASALSVLSLAAVLSNLDMEMDPRTLKYTTLTELVPLVLVIFVILATFCPFNIFYHSSRFFLIRCVWHCACAPFHKGNFTDFFLADQLTSQCIRRVIEEKDRKQGLNAGKYLSTIMAIAMRTIYDQKKGNSWRIVAAITSGFTTIYSTYWDIVFDWGLVQRNSRNPWLREELLISNKAVYFAAIVVNILLRLVWMQSVLDFNETEFLHRRAVVAVVACLEIIRRGIWNFFRLENEHLSHIGKNRAIKTAPLPSYYQD